MSAIFKREFSSYMRNVTGPLFIALILLFEGITCTIYNLVLSSPHFEYSLNYLQLVLIVAICDVTDITPIASLKHLEYLEIFHNRTNKSVDFQSKSNHALFSVYVKLRAENRIVDSVVNIAVNGILVADSRCANVTLIRKNQSGGNRSYGSGGLFVVMTDSRHNLDNVFIFKTSCPEKLKSKKCSALSVVASVDGVSYIVKKTRNSGKLAAMFVITENRKNSARLLARPDGVRHSVLRISYLPENVICGLNISKYLAVLA